jgi:hypothetical protein
MNKNYVRTLTKRIQVLTLPGLTICHFPRHHINLTKKFDWKILSMNFYKMKIYNSEQSILKISPKTKHGFFGTELLEDCTTKPFIFFSAKNLELLFKI